MAGFARLLAQRIAHGFSMPDGRDQAEPAADQDDMDDATQETDAASPPGCGTVANDPSRAHGLLRSAAIKGAAAAADDAGLDVGSVSRFAGGLRGGRDAARGTSLHGDTLAGRETSAGKAHAAHQADPANDAVQASTLGLQDPAASSSSRLEGPLAALLQAETLQPALRERAEAALGAGVSDAALQLGSAAAAAPSASAADAPPALPDMPTRYVPAPPGTPAFATAISHEVTLLARDGVHEARLQLNPVDLGPVVVRIAMEGGNARVDFMADAQATRDAIQGAFDQLAGALQGAGLMLSGGGVFQQSQSRQRDAQDDQRTGSKAASRIDPNVMTAAPRAMVRSVTRGVLDLYA